MTDWALPNRDQESWDNAGRAEGSGRRLRRTVLLALLAGMLIPMLAAGCGESMTPSRVIEVDPSNFRSAVLESKLPVLVNFYKEH